MEQARVRRALEALERERRRDLQGALLFMGGIVVATLVLAATLFLHDRGEWVATLWIGGVVVAARYRRHVVQVTGAFKQDLMPEIIARVHPGLDHYDPEGLPQEPFVGSGLFEVEPDNYRSKDLLAGRVGSTAVAFAMVRAEKNDANRKGRPADVLFEGLFFVADFNKHFQGRTHVKAGGAGLAASMRDAHVALEDPRFGRAFAVTSNDQVEARYILTPALAERLLALQGRFKSLDAVFVDDCIFVALGASYALLDPLVADGIDTDDLDSVVAQLKGVVGLVEELNLNTRIWSKRPVG